MYKKIEIVTSRSGGPLIWGENLLNSLQKRDQYVLGHVYNTKGVFSLFFKKFNILHTTLPISSLFKGKGSILTIHGNFNKEKNIWSRFYKSAISTADVITTPSEYLKRELELTNAIVIPNAIQISNYTKIHLKEQPSIRLLTVTNFHFQEKARGIEELIKIISRVKNRKDIGLSVLGEGRYLSKVKWETRRSGLKVNFSGYQNTKYFLKSTDIFVYYSYFDNMPLVIMEAMASGLPVITNSVGAVSEIIRDGCNGVIAVSPDEYVNKLNILINDFGLRKLIGNNANETIKQSFCWDKVVDDYIKVYEEIS